MGLSPPTASTASDEGSIGDLSPPAVPIPFERTTMEALREGQYPTVADQFEYPRCTLEFINTFAQRDKKQLSRRRHPAIPVFSGPRMDDYEALWLGTIAENLQERREKYARIVLGLFKSFRDTNRDLLGRAGSYWDALHVWLPDAPPTALCVLDNILEQHIQKRLRTPRASGLGDRIGTDDRPGKCPYQLDASIQEAKHQSLTWVTSLTTWT